MFGVPFLQKYLKDILKVQTVADTVDFMNYYTTSYILAFFAFAISCKQYFGSPLQCWTPKEFGGGWDKYTENYCFIANSYHVPMEDELPSDINDRGDRISYYRWIPIVLALQSFAFYFPNYLWNILHKKTAINPRIFLTEAKKCVAHSGDKRKEEITKLAEYFMETVGVFGQRTRTYRRTQDRSGYNAMYLYLLTKALYAINIIAQIAIVNHFLGGDYLGWGVNIFTRFAAGEEWQESPIFPRIIYCDFKVRRLANIQNHSVQCVMMLNMINEKIYAFLFLWFLIILVFTISNFGYYFIMMMVPSFRHKLVLSYIDSDEAMSQNTSRLMNRFVHECLHPDGVLLLKFVREHAGGPIANELTKKLKELYENEGLSSFKAYSEGSIEKQPLSPSVSGNERPSFYSNYAPPPSKDQFYPDLAAAQPLQVSAPLMDYTDNGTMRVADRKANEPSRNSPTDV